MLRIPLDGLGQGFAQILVEFDHGDHGIRHMGERLFDRIPLGNELREYRTGDQIAAFGLCGENQGDLIGMSHDGGLSHGYWMYNMNVSFNIA
jgi:hypothetical protein